MAEHRLNTVMVTIQLAQICMEEMSDKQWCQRHQPASNNSCGHSEGTASQEVWKASSVSDRTASSNKQY